MLPMRIVFLTLLLFSAALQAQDTYSPGRVNELKDLREKVIKSNFDSERKELNQKFHEQLLALLHENKKAELDSIPSFGIIKSPDKAFTFYTWNIQLDDEGYVYHNIVVFKDGVIFSLEDKKEHDRAELASTYTPDQWVGALYYEIIPVKDKKNGKYYLLLGWDGYMSSSTRKVIDVFWQDERLGTWKLGKKVFHVPFQDQTRIFLEYSADVTISLKYHESRDQIVFDHLVPVNQGMEGIYEFYVPDMSFDALEFRKNKWYFIQNVDIRGEQTMKNYVEPELIDPPER